MPVGFINAAGTAAPTGGASAHASLRMILGYTGSEIIEAACPRVPVDRGDVGEDGLIADYQAREEIAAALAALAERAMRDDHGLLQLAQRGDGRAGKRMHFSRKTHTR